MTFDLERIRHVVENATGQPDELVFLRDRFAELATPSTSRLVFDHDDLQIRVGLRRVDPVVDSLRQIEALEISAAPVVAGSFPATKAHVIVLRYWACPDEQRVDIKNPIDAIAEDVRRRFRDDIVRLADAGFMHEYVIRGTSYWRQGAKSNTLVLEDWTNLVPVEDGAKMIQRLSLMLGLT
jgi:hypothetical protein